MSQNAQRVLLLFINPLLGQVIENGSDEYLMSDDNFDDIYASKPAKNTGLGENNLTFNSNYNTAFNNAVLIEQAAIDGINDWYYRQFNLARDYINNMFNENYANFDDARDRMFLESEKGQIIPMASSVRSNYNTQFYEYKSQNNNDLSALNFLEYRKSEINSGNINNPSFPYIKIEGTYLKDLIDISALNQKSDAIELGLYENLNLQYVSHNIVKSLDDILENNNSEISNFNQFILNLKINNFNSRSQWEKLNLIQYCY